MWRRRWKRLRRRCSARPDADGDDDYRDGFDGHDDERRGTTTETTVTRRYGDAPNATEVRVGEFDRGAGFVGVVSGKEKKLMQKPGSPAKPVFRVSGHCPHEAGAEVAGAGAVAGEVFEAAPGLGGGVEHGGEVEGVVVELAGVAGEEGFGRGAEDGGEDRAMWRRGGPSPFRRSGFRRRSWCR
jgi:hypothetical protein